MPSTIITKNGSGAPLAADLVAGELAVDLTNGRLYTEDTGGSVIEIGLNPSGNVDVTGTVTADGLTVDNTSAANIYLDGTGTGRARVHSTYGILNLTADADSDTAGTSIKFKSGTTDRMLIDSDTGDISFYEDTGTTAKLFWDASEESLGIGTSSPNSYANLTTLTINGTSGSVVDFEVNGTLSGEIFAESNSLKIDAVGASGVLKLLTNSTERLRIDNSGNVGIGTSDPSSGTSTYYDDLVIKNDTSGTGAGITIQSNTTNGFSAIEFRKTDGTQVGKMYASNADGQLAFETGGTERLRIDSSGNVGIGTTDPTVASGHGLAIYDATVPRVQLRNSTSGDTSSDGAGIFMSGSDLGIENRESSNIIFYNNTEKMRIDSAGNLLVGTTDTPLTLISATTGDGFGVAGADGYLSISRDAAAAALYLNKTNGQGGTHIQFRADGATVGSIGSNSGTYMYAGTGDTGILFNVDANGVQPWDTSTNANSDGLINLGFSSSRFKDLYLSGGVYFSADLDASNNTTTNGTNVVEGNIRVASTSYCFDANRANAVDGEVFRFRKQAVQVGNISVTGSATAYNTSSDYRLKENVVAMSGATERLKKLKPSRFNFIADPDKTVDGFLAHEVQDIVPEAITGTKDAVDAEGNPEYQGIDQSKLVPLLVATIQELEARIAQLEGAN